MYWSFTNMNVSELIPIDAIVKFVVAPDMHFPLVFAHNGLELPEWMTLSALLLDPLIDVYMWIYWLLILSNSTWPIKLSSIFDFIASWGNFKEWGLTLWPGEFGESSPLVLCIDLRVNYRLQSRLWVVSPGHYWRWLTRIYHAEVTQQDSNHERSTASWGIADTLMAYDASCNHSGLLVLTLTNLKNRTDLVKSVCEALAGPSCWSLWSLSWHLFVLEWWSLRCSLKVLKSGHLMCLVWTSRPSRHTGHSLTLVTH
jgi:hypothetical protein